VRRRVVRVLVRSAVRLTSLDVVGGLGRGGLVGIVEGRRRKRNRSCVSFARDGERA
jgi:hypothetical protein